MRHRSTRAALAATLVLAGCTASKPAVPPLRLAIDRSVATGISPRRVVSVGEREAVVEAEIGAVVVTPTGGPIPPSYDLVLVVGSPGGTAHGPMLESLTLTADGWRVETALGLAERVTDGAWGTTAPAGTHVRLAPDGPGRVRVTLPEATLRRLAASRVARIAWVNAYRR